jgi:hypothetical protein
MSSFGARGLGAKSDIDGGVVIEVSRKGSPKPGAAPAAVGTAEIRRIVGTGSGCGEVPEVGDSVRG